jgi:hypothetical protein
VLFVFRSHLFLCQKVARLLSLLSRICGLIPVQGGVPTCDKGLFP